MSSTRLPGKALAPIAGEPVLALLLRRLRHARELDAIVLATSTESSDDAIAQAGEQLGIPVVRGSLSDVLGRYLLAAEQTGAEGVVRITADCPLIDPAVVDEVCAHWRATGLDYVTNTLEPRSYPDGLDVEVVGADALRRMGERAREPGEREHVTLYIRRHLDEFRTGELRLEPPLGDVRITLDTADDRTRIEELVASAGADADMSAILAELGVRATSEVVRRP